MSDKKGRKIFLTDLYNLGPKEITIRPSVKAIPNLQVVYNIKIRIINICYVL